MEPFLLISLLASALFHAWYNFLLFKAKGSRAFLLILFVVAAICANIVFFSTAKPFELSVKAFLIIYGASAFYVLYQIFVSLAYEKGEISRLYPLTVLSPVVVPIWAGLFLKESLNPGIIAGIIISSFGAITVKQTSFSFKEFWKIFTKENMYKGAGYALLASLVYSFASVLDKSQIGEFFLTGYLALLLSSMAVNIIIYSCFLDRTAFNFSNLNWKLAVFAGILGYLSFFTFRTALQHVQVSVAIPIRTSSIIFAVMFGVFFAKEKLNLHKLIGLGTIIIGILIINFSFLA